ncbi:arylamine N-acetyltransferase 1 [Westerdykella ornata]|uniref:Arylamine N-acetyltransferase 1 n=1 Tax=Westerdykella ornata TaxID=318751 RepID=A0A6A6J562_WESOR|nr:arylamine N-acetyltransferase 1 [Westerdykella ornata]KAF2271585.1 arylamine N-acetyltransferase 1 [Westerdykella ornata]
MSSSPQRATYTREQIEAYFNRIKLPEQHRKYDIAGLTNEEALEYLSLLQRYQLAYVPFENLTLHYSFHRQISIHPEDLFKKIVGDNNGRGGYCMENNTLFGTVLHTLGFTIFSVGARVYDTGNWIGWSHMANIVTIGRDRYHVDVGFGGNGPVVPMKLNKDGLVQPHINPASARLQWRNIPGNSDPDQRLWVYEVRINDESDFQMMYCFTELEFLPCDYAVMNYFTSTSQRSFFTRVIVAERKVLDDEGNIIGQLIMNNGDIKWRINGKKTKEIIFETEEDRLKHLEEHFGIVFSPVEREHIKGLPSRLS